MELELCFFCITLRKAVGEMVGNRETLRYKNTSLQLELMGGHA